jgi:hypothetical protein
MMRRGSKTLNIDNVEAVSVTSRRLSRIAVFRGFNCADLQPAEAQSLVAGY